MNTSFLYRVIPVFLLIMVPLSVSSCKTASTGSMSLQDLAEQGDSLAQYNLGVLHMGKETTQDNKLAVKYFREAAEQGHVDAQHQLGRMLIEGSRGNLLIVMLCHELFNRPVVARNNKQQFTNS